MHQHLSACLSYLSVCLSAPFLAASTNRAVLAEYIKSIFVSIFVSFWLYSSHKIMCLCLFGVMMSYQMTWLTAAALIGGRSFGLFHFAGNGGLTVMVTGPSVPKRNYNTNNNNNKKDYAVLLSDSTSRSNLQLSKSGHIALFCFKL